MGAKMESSSPALSRRKSFGALVLDAIGPAAKKLRLFLNDDYATYASSLLALDVVEEQLRSLPLAQVDRYVVDRGRAPPVDESVVLVLAGTEWMIRLDLATNALEDLVQEMEAIADRGESSALVEARCAAARGGGVAALGRREHDQDGDRRREARERLPARWRDI
jgi:hypothetical protein